MLYIKLKNMKLFEFFQHIGDWRVLVQTRDVADRAITEKKMADNSVGTRSIQDKAVTPEKLNPRVKQELVVPETEARQRSEEQLQQNINAVSVRIDTFEKDFQRAIENLNEGGVIVSNQFGDNQNIGISQKTLTEAFTKVWEKLDEITGESSNSIMMTVSPDYYYGLDGTDVSINAACPDSTPFEYIAFFFNGEKVIEAENVYQLPYTGHISDTTTIRCEAKVLGRVHVKQHTVKKLDSFWLGAGTSYLDIMDAEHAIPFSNGIRLSKDVLCHDRDHLYVVIDERISRGFIRADMNGFEIPMNATSVVIDGVTYTVYTSENIYSQGTYNIDING